MDSDDLERLFGKSQEEIHEDAINALVNSMSKWQSDSPTDVAARAILSGLRPLIDAMANHPENINKLVFALVVKQYITTVTHLQALDAIANIRDSGAT